MTGDDRGQGGWWPPERDGEDEPSTEEPRRCADRDLGRWLTGGYAIPSREPEDVEKAEEEAAGAGLAKH